MPDNFLLLRDYLTTRYAGESELRARCRHFVQETCEHYVQSGLADSNFLQALCCGDEARFWQRFSEALFASELTAQGLELHPSHNGPDFLVVKDGRKIWIEAICPEPIGIPAEWLNRPEATMITLPHEAILLRWTAAIKEKSEKLYGNPKQGISGYIQNGTVGPDDLYVIAINGRRLRAWLEQLIGISQFPFAVEAAFAVGPYQLHFERSSTRVVRAGHQHRPILLNANNAPVPSYAFLDSENRRVSAIWAADIDDCRPVGNPQPFAVVHNPNALHNVGLGVLPANKEYVATQRNDDEYDLATIEGLRFH